ncbi:PEGA domain-containing protein [Sandaracinus amylolyticus]|uniref:PEGA domain-containing protein n=1 Tax=Sandaracinus amylolyticus TaxID=927083 RepID=UPI001F31CBEA|nr:PEGA domain-containing protein [Sandaracinus amylolyticus]UJR81798.1 Thiol-disulfide isomerase [Sandaracinus amylolyticus]
MAIALAPALLAPAIVSAQQAAPSAEQRQRARELYGEGQTHFEAGRFAEALAAFEGAYREVPNPVVLLGVASAQERLGNPLDASRTLRRYLRERPDAPDRATIEQRIAQMDPTGVTASEEPATPAETGTIRVVCTPAGAAIALDGADTGRTAPADLEVPAGEHTVTLTLGGYLPISETVTVTPGGMNELALTLVAASAEGEGLQGEGDAFGEAGAEEAPAEGEGEGAAEAPPPTDTGPSAGVWVTTAIAGVGLVTGTIFGFLALSEQSDFDAMPTADAADRGETFALIADLSFGVAIAAGVTAIVLYAVDRPQPQSEVPPTARRDEGPRFTLAPWASPTAGGAAARIEF